MHAIRLHRSLGHAEFVLRYCLGLDFENVDRHTQGRGILSGTEPQNYCYRAVAVPHCRIREAPDRDLLLRRKHVEFLFRRVAEVDPACSCMESLNSESGPTMPTRHPASESSG